ncbi:NgoMIV family type II restriction endonuclease [Micromonospora chalcea]|uniref:NgoMIV family type II restriction endonuclease n=1 Tax=Micromonospora TaxID=1873 RepID=UPI0033E6B464
MPASFVTDLCGYRLSKDKQTITPRPNTSDSSDKLSVQLGRKLFDILGVSPDQRDPGKSGEELGAKVIEDLSSRFSAQLAVSSGSATGFRQFAHLKAFAEFKSEVEKSPHLPIDEIIQHVETLPRGHARSEILRRLRKLSGKLQQREALTQRLLTNAPEESLLGLDVTVADATQPQPRELRIALSLKWSLRTDRAQDCLSQGAKLATLRRGKMPHYGVVTMEPRPYMLAILCDGSGAVDFVYHLNLAALQGAVEQLARERGGSDRWKGPRTLDRLVSQGRLRDYDELLKETASVAAQIHIEGAAAAKDPGAIRRHRL